MAALAPSGPDGVSNSLVAVECTVPLLCVSKRFSKRHKYSEATGERVITDYIKIATEQLGYEWTDAVARLYDDS